MRDHLLCLDLGTTRLKAAAFDERGDIAAAASAPAPPLATWHGFAAFDAERCLEKSYAIIGETVRSLAGDCRVCGVTLTGQRATIVPVRADGKAVGPALSWQDTSGEAALAAFMRGVTAQRFSHCTGLPPSTLWSLAKILRLRTEFPQVWSGVARVVLLHDFVLYHMGAGRWVTDPSNASLTGLFDLRECRWSAELLAAAAVSESMLSELTPAGTLCGTLKAEAAGASGLPAGLPLFTGGGDQQCAALGAGAIDPGEAALCLGTAAVLSCPTREPAPELSSSFFCTAHVIPKRWVLEGIHNAFASSLEWVGALLGATTPDARIHLMSQSRPGAGGVLFLPFLSGIGSPDYEAAAAGTFLGLRLTHTPADVMRAAYEGTLLEARRMLEAVEARVISAQLQRENSFAGRVRIGGRISSGETGQLFADVLGREVVVMTEPEVSLRGAAILGWTALGRYADITDAVRKMGTSPCRVLIPRDNGYNGVYESYKRRVGELRAVYTPDPRESGALNAGQLS